MDKPQLMIVEDNTDLSEMLNSYFRVQNYDVLVANWGEEALRLSQEHKIDLVVLDIRLPDIDGYESADSFGYTAVPQMCRLSS